MNERLGEQQYCRYDQNAREEPEKKQRKGADGVADVAILKLDGSDCRGGTIGALYLLWPRAHRVSLTGLRGSSGSLLGYRMSEEYNQIIKYDWSGFRRRGAVRADTVFWEEDFYGILL